MVFLGTQRSPTEPQDQGRILGIAEIGPTPVDTTEVLDESAVRDFGPDAIATKKWPKALLMVRAWRILEKPLVTDALREQLSFQATVRAVLLDTEDAAAVLDLRVDEVPLPDTPLFRNHRAASDALRPTTGPVPTSWAGAVARDAAVVATTYAFRFGVRDIWKIGHAQDARARLKEVNAHVPHEALGERWSIVYEQTWPTQIAAYLMEQRILNSMPQRRTKGERLQCPEQEIRAAWLRAITP